MSVMQQADPDVRIGRVGPTVGCYLLGYVICVRMSLDLVQFAWRQRQ
jgi:hypothetical protein